MASFVMWIDFSAHNYLETLQDLRLGFPKRPYFLKSVQMTKRGDPLKKEARDSQAIYSQDMSDKKKREIFIRGIHRQQDQFELSGGDEGLCSKWRRRRGGRVDCPCRPHVRKRTFQSG